MKALLAVLVLSVFLFKAYASTQLGFPGGVPKDDSRPYASDLFYQGKVLLPSEIRELKNSGTDLSLINPKESDLWKDAHNSLDEAQINFADGEGLQYLSFVLSRSGNFRFSAIKDDGVSKKIYTVMLSKKVHNVLLRAALLKKLGYQVPAIKHIKNLKVQFSSPFEKENFLGRLSEDTLGDSTRWVKTNEEDKIELQDVLIMEGQQSIYNLAIGSIPAGVISNRRVLNSLLVPFSLVDVPESINLYSWNGFSLLSNNIRFDYEASDDFTPSFDDVRWMVKRIEKLTRDDFVEIARFAKLPSSVESLLVEKMISRRNTLMLVSEIPYVMMGYNDKISYGDEVQEGKLVRQNFEGYASRFAYGDPESPLSAGQVLALLKNKGIAYAISYLADEVNKRIMPQSNLEEDVLNKQIQIAEDNLARYLQTGEVKSIPTQVWAVPHFNTNIIVSRDIVTGSYLGTDNLVQLADTVGLGVDLGVYLGVSNLPVPWQGSGQVKASFLRRYSHIKPIKTMKVKMPWKNLLVPWLIKTQGHIFDDVINAQNKYTEATQELESVKQAISTVHLETLTLDQAQALINQLSHSVGMIASLVKEREYQKELEIIEEAQAELKAYVQNNDSAKVVQTVEGALENLPSFENPKFEEEKTQTVLRLKETLAILKDNADRNEKTVMSFVENWSSFRKRLASMKGEEKVAQKMQFVVDAQYLIESLRQSFNPQSLEELYVQLPQQIETVTQDIATDRKERMNQTFELLKNELKVGESLLITDSVGAGANITGVYNAADLIQIVGGMNANQVVLSRLHIYRNSENTIQIYKDNGSMTGVGLRSELRAGVPTLVLTGNLSKGKATTKFYQLALDTKNVTKASQVASALRALFVDNSLELVQTIKKPYELEHRFTEGSNSLSLLFWDWKKVKTSDELVIKHPEGGEKKFYRVFAGRRFSSDFLGMFIDIGNFLLREFDANFQISNKDDADASDSYFGKGVVRQLSFEGEDVGGKLGNPTVTMNYSWKGWKISYKKAQKILKKLNERFGTSLYYPEAMSTTSELQLYNISVSVYLYAEGIQNLAHLPKDQVRKLVERYLVTNPNDRDSQIDMMVSSFTYYQKKYLKALDENDAKKIARFGEKMIAFAEANFPMKEFKMIAGEKNIFITSRVQGFRKGDENGDRPLVSNTWGEIGSQYSQGPMTAIKNIIGMTESEFLGSWLFGRL